MHLSIFYSANVYGTDHSVGCLVTRVIPLMEFRRWKDLDVEILRVPFILMVVLEGKREGLDESILRHFFL